MAIADLATYKAKALAPFQVVQNIKGVGATITGSRIFTSCWTLGGSSAGAAPTTAVECTSALAGSMGQLDSSGVMRLIQTHLGSSLGTSVFLLADRLSHQGGLSGTTTGAQTTNLPTAALTRYTSGVGVWPLLEIYTDIGGTAQTVTASYTDQAGNSGHTTIATVIGGAYCSTAKRALVLPLASGDSGCRTVASVTLSDSTGTAGSIGVTLIKPLLMIPYPDGGVDMLIDAVTNFYGQMPQIYSGACLCWYLINYGGTSASFNASMIMAEE